MSIYLPALPEARPGCYGCDAVVMRRNSADLSYFGRLANRTGDWVRMIGVILAAEPVKVEVNGETKELGESWLQ